MTKERALKFDELIKKELGKILFEFLETEPGILVTITRVITAPNLFESEIYISVYPSDFAKKILEKLNKSIWKIQQELNKNFKVRPVPKIIFKHDKNPEEASEVEKLIKKVQKR